MIKIVGSAGLLSLMIASCVLCAQELVINITDMRDIPTSVIEVGVPFKVKVSVNGFSIQGRELEIKGLEQAVVDAHQEQISIINGVRSCVHTYCARIDQAGSYLVGPAVARMGGTSIESEPVKLIITKAKNNAPAKKEPFIARLTCEKESIFLGEKVYCHIHFYAKNPDARLTNLLAPSFNVKIDNTQYQGPFESMETIQGVQYICRHVQWLCCPKTVGELVIPAYTIVYTLPSDDRAQFGGFSAFFGMRPTQHLLYTNAVTLKVKPLPAYTGPDTVQAIGDYTRYELIPQQKTVEVGQALIVTLQVTGSGDIDALAAPELQGLPSSCKQYESQATVTAINDTISKKSFEYILQAGVPGTMVIPEQKFVFFDTKAGRYKTLTTRPQEIVVTAPPAQQADDTQVLTHNDTTQQSAPVSDASAESRLSAPAAVDYTDTQECPLMTDGWYYYSYRTLPWWLLFLLFVMPPCVALICALYRMCMHTVAARRATKKTERAFMHARAALLQAQEQRDYAQLYPIFKHLIAVRLSSDQQIPADERVRSALLQAGFSEQLCDEWQHFFSDCAAFVFLDNAKQADSLMFKQAHYWLSLLEQAL